MQSFFAFFSPPLRQKDGNTRSSIQQEVQRKGNTSKEIQKDSTQRPPRKQLDNVVHVGGEKESEW